MFPALVADTTGIPSGEAPDAKGCETVPVAAEPSPIDPAIRGARRSRPNRSRFTSADMKSGEKRVPALRDLVIAVAEEPLHGDEVRAEHHEHAAVGVAVIPRAG